MNQVRPALCKVSSGESKHEGRTQRRSEPLDVLHRCVPAKVNDDAASLDSDRECNIWLVQCATGLAPKCLLLSEFMFWSVSRQTGVIGNIHQREIYRFNVGTDFIAQMGNLNP